MLCAHCVRENASCYQFLQGLIVKAYSSKLTCTFLILAGNCTPSERKHQSCNFPPQVTLNIMLIIANHDYDSRPWNSLSKIRFGLLYPNPCTSWSEVAVGTTPVHLPLSGLCTPTHCETLVVITMECDLQQKPHPLTIIVMYGLTETINERKLF